MHNLQDAKWIFFYPKYAMYVWFPVFLSSMISYDIDLTILCAMGYDAMALAHELFALFLLKSFFFLSFLFQWPLSTNQDSNCIHMREKTCGTRDDMIARQYQYYCMYAMEGISMITDVHK